MPGNFLNFMRYNLAIDAETLQRDKQEQIKREVNTTLKEPWNFDEDERLYEARWFAWNMPGKGFMSLSLNSALGSI